jgi:hypothetical protein
MGLRQTHAQLTGLRQRQRTTARAYGHPHRTLF